MDTDVALGVCFIVVSLPFLIEYGLKRLSRRIAKRNLARTLARDEDEWGWDNLAAADVKDRIRHNARIHNG